MLKKLGLIVAFLAFALQGCTNKTDPNNPKMPYDSWGLQVLYPHYMTVGSYFLAIETQDNKIINNVWPSLTESTTSEGKWSDYPGGASVFDMYMNLPKQIGLCWVSHLDKKNYWAKFEIPLSARKMMVEPISIITPIIEKPREAYRYKIWIGLAPDGSVTVWLGGVALPRTNPIAPIIVKTQGIEINNNEKCSGYENVSDIPDISAEGKAWIKTHGLPKSW